MSDHTAHTLFGERFLKATDLFPARRAGESWGEHEAVVQFAGGAYRFRGMSAAQAEQVRARFGGGRDESGAAVAAAVDIAIYRATPDEFRPILYQGTEYRWDMAYADATVRLAGDGFMAHIDRSPRLAAALWVPDGEGPFHLGTLENVFRVIVAYRLLERGGMLLHSAGVVWNGAAHLFVGPSGAGKTTIARLGLGAGLEVLSDDLNAVVSCNGTVVAEKLPFAGDLGRTPTRGERFPLAGVFRVHKGESNAFEASSAASAVAAMIAAAPFLNADPGCADQLVRNAEAVAARVATGQLRFARDGGFWDLLPRSPAARLASVADDPITPTSPDIAIVR